VSHDTSEIIVICRFGGSRNKLYFYQLLL